MKGSRGRTLRFLANVDPIDVVSGVAALTDGLLLEIQLTNSLQTRSHMLLHITAAASQNAATSCFNHSRPPSH
jgi:hypothetical protein